MVIIQLCHTFEIITSSFFVLCPFSIAVKVYALVSLTALHDVKYVFSVDPSFCECNKLLRILHWQ